MLQTQTRCTRFMPTIDMVRSLASGNRLAVGLVYDPTATPAEAWIASIGLSAIGAGYTPEQALFAALADMKGC